MVEGKSTVPPGAKVVLLEDVFTTGGSALKSVEVLKAEGYDVIGVIGLVDREEGAAEAFAAANMPYVSVFKKSELLSDPK
jgi:orotate phosphoribosyltransferase